MAFEASAGIVKWASNIHNRLQNDPTRAAFKELVQVQGFLFLEEYLEEVLKGPKDQPVIELAKTPGRRKETQKRTRAAVAAVAATATKLKTINDKENVAPFQQTTNSLQKELLRAKAEDEKATTPVTERLPLAPSRVAFAAPQMMEVSDDRKSSHPMIKEPVTDSTTPTPRTLQPPSFEDAPASSSKALPESDLASEDVPPPDLSVIQEDEEVERAIAVGRPAVSPLKPTSTLFEQQVAEANEVLNERLSGPSIADSADSWTTALSNQPLASSGEANKEPAAAAPRAPSARPPSSNKLANAHPRSFPSFAPRSPATNKVPSLLPKSPGATSKIPRSPKMVSMPLSNQRGSPIPQSKLASTKPELAQQQPIQAQPVSIAPNRPSVAAINPLPGGSKMRSSWLTKAVADQGGQISMQPKKSLGAALAAQAKKSMGAHSGSAPSSAVLKRKSEQDDDLAKEREDYRKSKVLKSSYGGGLLSRSEEESRASKPASQPTKVETTAPTDIIVPISKESEDDEDEDEDEEDDDEGGEDFTSFDKLRENVGKFKEQRAKSIHHIDITERFNVNIKHLEDDVPQETSVTGDHMPNAKNSFSSVAQTTPVSTSNDARPPSLANVSSHSQTRLSLSELVSAKDLVPKKQDTADKGSVKSAALKEPPSFHLLKESIASTTPPNSPPKSHTLSKQNSFATAAKPPLFSKAATEVPQPTTSTNSEGSNKSSTWDDMMSLMNPPPSTSAASVPPPPQSIFFQQVEAPRSPSPAPVKPLANNPFLTKTESNPPSKANAFKVPADLFSAAAPLAPQSTFSSDTFSQTSSVPDSIFSVTQVDSQAFLYPEMGSFNEVFAQPVKETHVAQSNTGPTKPKEPVVAHVNPVPVSKETKVEETEEMDDADIEDDDGDVDMAEETQLTQPEVPATPSSGMLSASSIFGTAAHLVAKAFGSSKAKKEPLKSLHAAAAAKAEQEEKEREKARRKEQMEQRRLVANQKNQKKMGDERAKQAEAEKKKKEEVERKKREREEMNVSKVGKGKKVEEEEPVKKRKITVEVGKKPELKKQPSKDKLNASFQAGAVAAASSIARANTSRPASQQSNYTSQASAKPAIKKATGVASSSQTVGATSGAGPSFSKLPQNISQTVAPPTAASSASVKLVPVGPPNVNGWTASNTASGSSKPVPATTPKQVQRSSKASLNGKQPSQAIHAQMQARVAAQMGKDKEKEEAVAASEQIELPDINSEYSDSEDEDRGKDLPDWAQSPELADALRSQRTFNPEDLFGPIGPLKMEEIFKTRHSRFRSRTSSANWNGADRLTEMEELEYARRMGFR